MMLIMVSVTAVRTTGIYCRAGCPARPLERNTAPFRSAVAAEAAGYRACLRCRPDLGADSTVDGSAPSPVRRAVDLISHGFLDSRTEADLAAFVGYSARHLRRLFLEHVGATPDAVARSRRVHFARRLLDDTQLPLVDVAIAAGFTSSRQMGRVMSDVFGFAPSRLRGRVAVDRGSIDGGFPVSVTVGAGSWARLIEHLGPRCTPGVEAVSDGRYCRTLRLAARPGVIEMSAGDSTPGDQLSLLVHLPTYAGLIEIVERTRRLVGADLDIGPALQLFAADELLGPILEGSDIADGLSIPGAWDGFETAVRIVIGQQVSVVGASTLTGRVVERSGEHVEGLDRLDLERVFPTPAQLANADLSGLGMTGTRTSTIAELAAAAVGGEIDFDVPAVDLRERVLAIKGIGPWTAEMTAMRVGRDLDAFPASDLVIRDVVGRLVGEKRPPAAFVEHMAEMWRPYRAVAATLLWRLARDGRD